MSSEQVETVFYRFGTESVSWIAECPWTAGLCYGTESGHVLIPGLASHHPRRVTEAINGIAFVDSLMGLSTRSEIVIYGRDAAAHKLLLKAELPHGAHGIIATGKSGFAVPLGAEGLLFLDRCSDNTVSSQRLEVSEPLLNCYQVTYLDGDDFRNVIACAGRSAGLWGVSRESRGESVQLAEHPLPGLDVIDVCSLQSSEWPLAVAALSRDRQILLTRSVMERSPMSLSLPGIQGTAYEIVSAKGHIIVLTSRELVVIPDVATSFLRGESLSRRIPFQTMTMEASDAFLTYSTSLLLLRDDEVQEIALDRLTAEPQATRQVVSTGLVNGSEVSDARTGTITRENHSAELAVRGPTTPAPRRPLAVSTASD